MALQLHARKPVIGNVAGLHRSPIRGSSLEFAAYREYVPGDDLRRLDWRAWGRSDRHYIKEFEADTNLRLILLLDASGSMNYPQDDRNSISRIAYTKKLAGSLAYLAARQGDAVGFWSCGHTVAKKDQPQGPMQVPARRGATHLGNVLDAIGSLQPEGQTSLVESLHAAAEQITQRALIVIFSDLFIETPDLRSALQHLRFRKHDVVVFHLLDERELDFNFDHPARFVDLEGAESMLVDPGEIGPAYRESIAAWLSEIDDIVTSTGIDYIRAHLQQDYADVLARFLLARSPKRRAG
jgi:uncharacterized protein (DUF58 family)